MPCSKFGCLACSWRVEWIANSGHRITASARTRVRCKPKCTLSLQLFLLVGDLPLQVIIDTLPTALDLGKSFRASLLTQAELIDFLLKAIPVSNSSPKLTPSFMELSLELCTLKISSFKILLKNPLLLVKVLTNFSKLCNKGILYMLWDCRGSCNLLDFKQTSLQFYRNLANGDLLERLLVNCLKVYR